MIDSLKFKMPDNTINILGYSLVFIIVIYILCVIRNKLSNIDSFNNPINLPVVPLDPNGNIIVPRVSSGAATGMIILPPMPNDNSGNSLLPVKDVNNPLIEYPDQFIAYISLPPVLAYLRSLVGTSTFLLAIDEAYKVSMRIPYKINLDGTTTRFSGFPLPPAPPGSPTVDTVPKDSDGNIIVPRDNNGILVNVDMPNDLTGKPLFNYPPAILNDPTFLTEASPLRSYLSIPVVLAYLRSIVGKPEFNSAMDYAFAASSYIPKVLVNEFLPSNVSVRKIRKDIIPSLKLSKIIEPPTNSVIELKTIPSVKFPESEYLKITSSTTIPYSDPQYGNAQVIKGGSNITISTVNLPGECPDFAWFINGNRLKSCKTIDSCNFNATTDLQPLTSTNAVLSGYHSIGIACSGILISRFPLWFN